MKRSRRLSRLADLEGGSGGLEQIRSLLNLPLGNKNIKEENKRTVPEKSHEISFPELFHALSLTQSTPPTPSDFRLVVAYNGLDKLMDVENKNNQLCTITTASSSSCSSSKSTTSNRKRVPSFLCNSDSDNEWSFNDIPSSDESYPSTSPIIHQPTPPCGVVPTRKYVVSKRRILVCTKFSLERKLPLDQVFLASVGVSGYKTGSEQLKVEAEDNTRDVISLISNIPVGYHPLGISAVECP